MSKKSLKNISVGLKNWIRIFYLKFWIYNPLKRIKKVTMTYFPSGMFCIRLYPLLFLQTYQQKSSDSNDFSLYQAVLSFLVYKPFCTWMKRYPFTFISCSNFYLLLFLSSVFLGEVEYNWNFYGSCKAEIQWRPTATTITLCAQSSIQLIW